MAHVTTVTAEQRTEKFVWEGAKPVPAAISLLIGLCIWLFPHPAGLTRECWQLFAIFVGTISGMITKPLPVGPVVLCGMITAMCSGTVSFDEIFQTYSFPGIWMIVLSFFLAQGLIRSGLAMRVAYGLVSLCGQSTIGLAYAIIGSELLLSPFIPSLVARSGGIIFPIFYALTKNGLGKENEGDKRTPAFLLMTTLHGSLICSNLFLTAMAGNPLVTEMGASLGIKIDWNTWALAALVPGIFSLTTVPYLIYRFMPPSTTRTEEAPAMARERLNAMGPMSSKEWLALGVFSLVLWLWVMGKSFGINGATAAMVGLALLLLSGVLTWKDCLEEKTGWDTLFWLGAIIGLGGQLKALGFFSWLSTGALDIIGDQPWYWGFLALTALYFYAHYLFASNIAHASSMFLAFLTAAIQLGAPPVLAFFTFAFSSNLFGGLTHYASGPAPLYFSTGYVSLKRWWIIGLVIGTYNLAVWLGLGSLWWHYLELW